MRTTIACERNAKVKCKYEGQAPCRGCLKNGHAATCVLSGPVLRRQVGSGSGARSSKRRRQSVETHEDVNPKTRKAEEEDGSVWELFRSVPREEYAKALSVFQAQFPEFGFVHPTDYDWAAAEIGRIGMLRLLAILAVASRYFDKQVSATPKDCAALVTRELHREIISPPGIRLIQTYLIMALYEWGEGEGFSAWMYAGIASRMAQASLVVRTPVNGTGLLAELQWRTLWTCFAIDKLLSCGRLRPTMFRLHEMEVPPPLSDVYYVFDADSVVTSYLGQHESLAGKARTTGDCFRTLLEGLNIWSEIHSWIVEGGRKQPHMVEPHNCPWNETSAWGRMRGELQRWRDHQEPRLRYPEAKVSAHVHIRKGEVFGYINLIYYTSLLFLCREYIPFLPVEETVQRGPIDPPFFTSRAPDGFWERNCRELFGAAAHMSDIMRDLRHAGTPLHTPFTGLCAFTSALMNLYAASFPLFVGPGFSGDAVERASASMEDLTKICGVWKLGEEWLSIVETAGNLFRRVNSAQGQPVRKSRYDHTELEDSIVVTTLRGMPQPDGAQASTSTCNGSAWKDTTASEQPAAATGQASELLDVSAMIGSEYMDEEDWRLWSFWDDPRLLTMAGCESNQGA